MKYNKVFISLILGALTLASCEDFLDQQAATSYTNSELFNSEELTARYMENIYSELTGDLYSTQLPILFGVNSDVELIDGIGATADAANERGYMNYNTSNAKDWTTNDRLYGNLYQVIGDCNSVISGISASDIKDNDKMKQYLGEAYVLRATMYMELTRIYGDVPAVFETAREDLTNVYVGKTDRDFIMDEVMKDLEKAEELLENSGKGADYANKWYAKALYAQLALQRCGYAIREPNRNQPYKDQGNVYADVIVDETGASHSFTYKDAKADADDRKQISDDLYPTMRCSDEMRSIYYAKALAKLNEIIQSGNFAVADNIADYWHNMTIRQSDADVCKKENIFEIPMKISESGELGYTVGVRLNWDEGTKVLPFGGRNSSGKVKLTSTLLYSYDANDKRRDVTCSLIEVKDSTVTEGSETISHIAREKSIGDNPFALYVGKWDARYLYENDAVWREQNTNANAKQPYGIHVVRMRYPMVLLYYAEILNELKNNGLEDVFMGVGDADDIEEYSNLNLAFSDPMDAVNAVHRPACGSNVSASGYSDILKAIEDENMFEFAGEGLRKWDLIRWNILVYNTLLMKDTYIRQMATKYQTTLAYDVEYKRMSFIYTDEDYAKMSKDEANARRYTKFYNFDYYGEGGRAVNLDSSFGKTYDDLAKKDKDPTKVIKNTDTNLPSISGGIVGVDALYTSQSQVKDNASKYIGKAKSQYSALTPASGVLNRYIFPLPKNVVSSSNNTCSNSYGY